MKTLTPQQKSALKAKAHSLKPVVLLGDKGLTEPVMTEIELALETHELIKIKIPGQDREIKENWIEQICEKSKSQLVQHLGHIVTLYRAVEKKIEKKAERKTEKKSEKKSEKK